MTCHIAAFETAFTRLAQGGTLTRARARTTWRALAQFAKEKKMILHPEKMTSKQVLCFVEYRLEQGITPRVLQNEISHIRRALRGAGRELGDVKDPKNNFGSRRLGVPQGRRTSTAQPVDVRLIENITRADVRAVCALQACMGLRQTEAIRSTKDLSLWQRALQQANEDRSHCFLPVVDGTKGGRERVVNIYPSEVRRTLEAVTGALAMVQGQWVVQSKSLEAANKAYIRACDKAGFQSHGLRRTFAVEQFLRYREVMSEADALRRLSRDLGHGDGRGRWVKGNYLAVLYGKD